MRFSGTYSTHPIPLFEADGYERQQAEVAEEEGMVVDTDEAHLAHTFEKYRPPADATKQFRVIS